MPSHARSLRVSARRVLLPLAAAALALLGCSKSPQESAAAADRLQEVALEHFAAGGDENWSAAERLFRDILRLREQAFGRESAEAADTHEALAEISLTRTDYDAALLSASRALEIRRRIRSGDDPSIADSQLQLAKAHYHRAEYAEAEALLLGARRAREARGDAAGLADLDNWLGETYRAWGRFADADRAFESAERVAETSAIDLLPMIINNRAGVYRDEGRFAEAQSALERSLALRESAAEPDAVQITTASLNLGELYREQGDFASASAYYERALSLAEGALGPEHPELAWFVSQLARLRQEQGRRAEAEAGYRRALVLRQSSPPHEQAQTLHDLGTLLGSAGSLAEAKDLLSRALELRTRALGDRHPDTAFTLVELAKLQSRATEEDRSGAALLVERALAVLEETAAHPAARVDAHALRADLLRESGERDAAIASVEKAISIVESLRPRAGGGEVTRAEFQRRYLPLYDRAIDWLAEKGDARTAFAYAERARARVLLDQVALSGVDLESEIPEAILAPLRTRREELAGEIPRLAASLERARRSGSSEVPALRRRLGEAEHELEHLLERIRNESPLWRAVSDPHVSIERVEAAVPDGGVLVSYHFGERASWLFLLPHGGTLTAHRLVSRPDDGAPVDGGKPLAREELDDLLFGPAGARIDEAPGTSGKAPARGLGIVVEEAGSALRRSDPSRLSLAWQLLVPQDVRARILAATVAVVVPDGPLLHFPLEALVVDFSAEGRPRYWLDAGPPVIYADSATLLVKLRERERSRGSSAGRVLVSLAAPEFDRAPGAPVLAPLPGTLRESARVRAAVRRMVPPPRVVTLAGAAATEARLRAALPGATLVHLATHGLFDPARSELFAALALARGAGSAEDDGFLRLHEVYGLRLHAELAVLSSCDSRSGKSVEGEGVVALARAFLAAGSERVVASLWRVDDEATSALIGGFFENLADSKHADYALALRDAKRAVRVRPGWEHPFYWAAFTYGGLP